MSLMIDESNEGLVQISVLGNHFFTAIPARWALSPAGIPLHKGEVTPHIRWNSWKVQ